MQPLEVRLPSPGGSRSSIWPPVALAIGTILVVAPLAAVATQGLDTIDSLDAFLLALAGVVIAGWGVLQLAGGGTRLHHDALLRLDEDGAALHTGGSRSGGWAQIAWADLSAIEIAWWEILPPFVEDPEHLPVLRFLSRYDAAIRVNEPTGLATDLGHAFGISPQAASLLTVLDPSAAIALQQVEAWLEAHRPDVPLEVGAPPAQA
ncbi:hypothetical protein ASE01_18950 [Nocardioides sp. Root190]|uniref:hypothetical protein n=1 Tax=Nocardioides sp. Root190 TaxID=1736488 RepID=UPI0007003CE4|nr:hypothetical protein [Nocardioides sp. Root190]KRB74071.1 hypothetical protein ASE01_18950 [Nocardioides sp. Root190]